MFNDIAPHYDFLNHFLSLHIDKWWRRALVRQVARLHPACLLDVATGTGDLALALYRKTNATVVGVDISEGMLAIAEKKARRRRPPLPSPAAGRRPALHWQTAAAEALPFAEHSFDAVTVAFGVRNFENRTKGLAEMFRVLQPGGTLAILEFAMPVAFPVKQGYGLYFRCVLPVMGRLFSRHRSAYHYLPASVVEFPQRHRFLHELQQAGFTDTGYRSLSCGIALLYVAKKPPHIPEP
jgi:demethylmenaquinone methyltransferase/2-methoxy-6-polyprenyl-1,4-benzoquinol methylase